ncbi:hypothetical protein GGI59_006051 [Rhizobium lentis]|uniref:Uncharacterized protein n=1 Tax=Rhizobium lentis TaxID=1138194 RepID=A0A7W9CYA8_9HYPH|nr:hypothetical protein [Rhizobium lentis]MBB5553782.1 hypothetical protein [Rhizobium lentis]MBB5564343.1 hypothetical protein [Rhizobium lentis]MBB5570857.1 hypothetical protein [Rhizobium lentis]
MATSHDPDTQAIVPFYIGLGFPQQGQRLWRIDVRTGGRLAVNQPMQQVQDVRLGRHACIQGQFHGPDNNLFVLMEDKSKDIGHLTVPAGAAEHLVLQLPEGQRQFQMLMMTAIVASELAVSTSAG